MMEEEQKKINRELIADSEAVREMQSTEGWKVLLKEIEMMREEVSEDEYSLLHGNPTATLEKKILFLAYRRNAIDWLKERLVNLLAAGEEAKEEMAEAENQEENITQTII